MRFIHDVINDVVALLRRDERLSGVDIQPDYGDRKHPNPLKSPVITVGLSSAHAYNATLTEPETQIIHILVDIFIPNRYDGMTGYTHYAAMLEDLLLDSDAKRLGVESIAFKGIKAAGQFGTYNFQCELSISC